MISAREIVRSIQVRKSDEKNSRREEATTGLSSARPLGQPRDPLRVWERQNDDAKNGKLRGREATSASGWWGLVAGLSS